MNNYQYGGAEKLNMSAVYKELTDKDSAKDSLRAVATKLNKFEMNTHDLTPGSISALVKILKSNNLLMMNIKLLDILVSQRDGALSNHMVEMMRDFPNNAWPNLTDAALPDDTARQNTFGAAGSLAERLVLEKNRQRQRIAVGDRKVPEAGHGTNIYTEAANGDTVNINWLLPHIDLFTNPAQRVEAFDSNKFDSKMLNNLFDNAKNAGGTSGVMRGIETLRPASTGLDAGRYIELIGILNDLRGFVLLYNLIVDLKDPDKNADLLKRIKEMVIPPTDHTGVYAAIEDVNEKLYRHCFYEQVDLFAIDYVTKKSAVLAPGRNTYTVSEHFNKMYDAWTNDPPTIPHQGIISKDTLWKLIRDACQVPATLTPERISVVKKLFNISDAAAWASKAETIMGPLVEPMDFIEEIFINFNCSDSADYKMLFLFLFSFGRNARMREERITLGDAPVGDDQLTDYQLRYLDPMFEKLKLELDARMKIADAVFKADENRNSDAITQCLSSIGQSYGAAGSSGVDDDGTGDDEVKDGRKDRENLSDDDSSGEVSGPLRKLKILNTFFEEYLSFTSLPTDESSYDVIESFVKNIYKALYDADKSGVIELKNPTEVSEIVKNDPRSKNGFSNKGTTMRLREYNKKARHITIRLVAMDSDNDYSKLPGHKSMYDTLKGDNFELLSEFTLQLFKNINLKPTVITEYFQNLGDTEIKQTKEFFQITYIVESQYSMLNLTKIGQTRELVERLRDDLTRKGKVNLEELGGEYAITVLGREQKGEWYDKGSGENVITDSQLVGDGVIFKIEDKHAQITDRAVAKDVLEKFVEAVQLAAANGAGEAPPAAISLLAEFLNLFAVVGLGDPTNWILARKNDAGNVVDKSYLYFNEKLEEHPSFKILKGKCLSDNPCVLEKINDKSLYDNGQWPENGKISLTKLQLIISEFPQALVSGSGELPFRFTFRPLKSTTGGGIGRGMHSLLYGGAGTEDGDDSVPEETEDPAKSKMHGTWENITTSSKQKKLLRNLSEYTISPDYINKRAAKELIQQNKVLKDKMVSRRAKMFGISNEPNPSDQNDQGDGDGTNNTESDEMKKIKEELKKQRELQAKALESQNKKALLDAQNQSTQLQQKLNQLANRTTNTTSGQQVRPSQTPAAPSSARPGQPPPARPGPPSPARPGQQPVKPGQQPVKPGKQPVKPNEKSSESDLPNESGQPEKKEPSFMDRLFSSSSDKDKEKDDFQKEKEDFQKEKEKQQEDEQKKKEMEERMEKLKKEEVIQTDLFKQLPHKSSPEYEKVKKLMIEQIKLIHKYNLLRQESFQLMLENSKYENLEYENKEQKELIKDLENKMFSIIQQILSSKTSNKNLNKLNSDLLSYIDDLKSNDPDGSLVDTDKYIELIESFKSSTKKRTLKKQKRLSNKKKGEKKKRTLKKLRQKLTPKKIKKKTPTKSKKITKVKRTPTKSKNFNKIQRTPTKSKK